MIIAESAENDLHLHEAPDSNKKPRYILVYGLETTRFDDRGKAMIKFVQSLAHAEAANHGAEDLWRRLA